MRTLKAKVCKDLIKLKASIQNPDNNESPEFIKKIEDKPNTIYYPNRNKMINELKDNYSDMKIKDSNRFDSIMDDRFMVKTSGVPKPRMYVTFDNAQSYPAYLITYDKGRRK